MKKKDEIRYLKQKIKKLNSKLLLLQANESSMLFLINENKRLVKKLKETSIKLSRTEGVLFNYQTQNIAP